MRYGEETLSRRHVYIWRIWQIWVSLNPMGIDLTGSAPEHNTHSKLMGYALWLFGFLGSHRFYYGRRWTGLLWMLTLGLFGVGWLIDLFLIPSMDASADRRYPPGPLSYDLAWILLTFLGVFGAHRFYQGKFLTGILYLLTGGLGMVGVAYDFWTLNEQIAAQNAVALKGARQRVM